MHEVAEPVHVPLRQRLVEAELLGDPVALLLLRERRDRLDRIAGQELEEDGNEERHDDQHDDELHDASQNASQTVLLSAS